MTPRFRGLFKIAGILGALFLSVKLALFASRWDEPINQFRRELADMQEERSDPDSFGDYTHCITGRLDPSGFHELATLLGLSSDLRADPHDLKGWQKVTDEPWWDIPHSPRHFDEQYYKAGHGYSVALGREGERIFYQYLSW